MSKFHVFDLETPRSRASKLNDSHTFKIRQSSLAKRGMSPLNLSKLNPNADLSLEMTSFAEPSRSFIDRSRLTHRPSKVVPAIKRMNLDISEIKKPEFSIRQMSSRRQIPNSANSLSGNRTERTFTNLLNVTLTSRNNSKGITMKEKIEAEREKSSFKLKKLKNHLASASKFPSSMKEKYYQVIERLDEIRIKRLERDLLIKENRIEDFNGDPFPYFNFFSPEIRVKNCEDVNRHKIRVLKLYDMVNKSRIWKRQ
jgi:hypothetical protein